MSKIQGYVNVANEYLPDVMRLVIKESDINLMLAVNTGILGADGQVSIDWKKIAVICTIDVAEDTLKGLIKGIELVRHYETLMLMEMKAESELKHKNTVVTGAHND